VSIVPKEIFHIYSIVCEGEIVSVVVCITLFTNHIIYKNVSIPDFKIHAMFYEYVGNFTGIWTTDEGLESYDFNRDHLDDLPEE
jgi:hypothetical protein